MARAQQAGTRLAQGQPGPNQGWWINCRSAPVQSSNRRPERNPKGPLQVPWASLLRAHQVPGGDAQRRDDAAKQQDQQDEGRRLLVLGEEPLGQRHRHCRGGQAGSGNGEGGKGGECTQRAAWWHNQQGKQLSPHSALPCRVMTPPNGRKAPASPAAAPAATHRSWPAGRRGARTFCSSPC